MRHVHTQIPGLTMQTAVVVIGFSRNEKATRCWCAIQEDTFFRYLTRSLARNALKPSLLSFKLWHVAPGAPKVHCTGKSASW
jgi:hypothetical protein